jgi:hypothetical protein
MFIAAVMLVFGAGYSIARDEHRLIEVAEEALPGPLRDARESSLTVEPPETVGAPEPKPGRAPTAHIPFDPPFLSAQSAA